MKYILARGYPRTILINHEQLSKIYRCHSADSNLDNERCKCGIVWLSYTKISTEPHLPDKPYKGVFDFFFKINKRESTFINEMESRCVSILSYGAWLREPWTTASGQSCSNKIMKIFKIDFFFLKTLLIRISH